MVFPLPQLGTDRRTGPAKPLPPFPETVIGPASAWQILDFGELWRYRDLLLMLTWRDISVRYKQTVLGIAWAVLQPTLMMAVFAVVFGRLAKLPSGDVPYPLFVFAGLLPWTFFATAVTNAAHSVVENERLVTKVYFPRLAIPLAAVGAALVDFAIAFSVLIALLVGYGVTPGWSVLSLPLVLLLLVLAAVGVGSLLAALNVSYRDFRYVVGFLVQLWMFSTPTIYLDYVGTERAWAANISDRPLPVSSPLAAVDADRVTPSPPHLVTPSPSYSLTVWETARKAVNLNPLTSLIAVFRAAVIGHSVPWASLGRAAVGSVSMFLVGLVYFRRVEDSFADII